MKIPAITNNVTELLAAIHALTHAPEGWSGNLYTDSSVTMSRLKRGRGASSLQPELQRMLTQAKKRAGSFTIHLLKGHPSEEELEKGSAANGYPVSKWNVMCDDLCNEQARLFLDKMNGHS